MKKKANRHWFMMMIGLTAGALAVAGMPSRAGAQVMYLQADNFIQTGQAIVGTDATGGGNALTKSKDDGGPPYVYDFGDAATGFSGSLDFQGRKLYTTGPIPITLDMGGNVLTGNTTTVAIDTVHAWTAGTSARGNVTLLNAPSIVIGKIDTRYTSAAATTPHNSGNVTIGDSASEETRIAYVRIGGIDTRYNASSKGINSGAVNINGKGDVVISSSTSSLDIDVRSSRNSSSVNVNHQGSLTVRDIMTSTELTTASTWWGAGTVTLNGNGLDMGATGVLSVGDISTYLGNASSTKNDGSTKGHITISGYASVHITGSLNTENRINSSVAAGAYAGNITITDIVGDIIIDGTINANAVKGPAYDGALTLAAGGGITVSNLDLSHVSYAAFNAGGESQIKGALTGSDGNPATPTTVGNLRAATGTSIYYEPELNMGLNGETVALNQPDGSSGGGKLRPPASGTVILLR